MWGLYQIRVSALDANYSLLVTTQSVLMHCLKLALLNGDKKSARKSSKDLRKVNRRLEKLLKVKK